MESLKDTIRDMQIVIQHLETKAKDYEEAFEEIRDFSKPYWRNMWAEKIIGIITKTLDKHSTNTALHKEEK